MTPSRERLLAANRPDAIAQSDPAQAVDDILLQNGLLTKPLLRSLVQVAGGILAIALQTLTLPVPPAAGKQQGQHRKE